MRVRHPKKRCFPRQQMQACCRGSQATGVDSKLCRQAVVVRNVKQTVSNKRWGRYRLSSRLLQASIRLWFSPSPTARRKAARTGSMTASNLAHSSLNRPCFVILEMNLETWPVTLGSASLRLTKAVRPTSTLDTRQNRIVSQSSLRLRFRLESTKHLTESRHNSPSHWCRQRLFFGCARIKRLTYRTMKLFYAV